MNPKIKDLFPTIKHLFWWVPESELASLSDEAIVESILNNGNEKTVKQLLDYYGIDTAGEIVIGPGPSISFKNIFNGMHRMTEIIMFKHILTANQLKLLPLVKEFSRDYYLVGGTAIALHLGHRRSIDFDLFTSGRLKKQSIKRTIDRHQCPVSDVLFEDSEQLHLVVHDVKLTFFSYPYQIDAPAERNGKTTWTSIFCCGITFPWRKSLKNRKLFSVPITTKNYFGNSSVTFKMLIILKKWTLSFKRFLMKRSKNS